MPEEIQKDTKQEEVEETKPEGEEQPEELSTSEEPTEEELPEDSKDRTREQFEKLKKHNAELKAELEQRKQLPSVLDYLGTSVPEVTPELRQQYQTPQPQQPQQTKRELLDESGYLNADVLQDELKQAQEAKRRAEEAERRSIEAERRIMKFEQDKEQEKLYQAYPELDPLNENFNKDAYDLVRNELTSQIVNTGKRDALSAAEKMSRFFRNQTPQDNKVLEQRRQATQPTGTRSVQTTSKPVSQMTTAERLKAWEERNNYK